MKLMCVGEDISVHIICAEKDTFEKHDHYGPLFLETNAPTTDFIGNLRSSFKAFNLVETLSLKNDFFFNLRCSRAT